MGLGGQLAQGHLCMLQRVALRAEGGIAQTRAAINTLEAVTPVSAIAKTIAWSSALI